MISSCWLQQRWYVVGREHFAPAVCGRARGIAVTRSDVEHLVSRADIDRLARLLADDRQSDVDASVIARRPGTLLLGLERLEAQQALPASRKIRALFDYLALAFQGWAPRDPKFDRAFDCAGRGLIDDDRDPAAHWAMGRTLCLRGRHDPSVVEPRRAIEMSTDVATGQIHACIRPVVVRQSRHRLIRSREKSRPPRSAALCEGARRIAMA